MRFAHISDLHLCQEPERTGVIRDDVHALVAALAQDIRRIGTVLDFVVLSGDLTDDAHADSFRQVEQIFLSLGLPLFLVPGNHDGPAAFFERKLGSDFLARCDISGRLVEFDGLRLLGINTCVEGEVTGAIAQHDLDIVAREFSSTANSPLVIVMHHPPFQTGLREFDEISRLENGERFSALLRESNAAPIILCGHVHRPYFARWHGASCFVAGSAAGQFAADLPFGDVPLAPSREEYSYFVHSLEGPGQHVVTPRSFDFRGAARQ